MNQAGPKATAAIALGSNLASAWGDREANLREAVERLSSLGAVVAVSKFHDTDPVGYIDQPRFLNGAALLQTELEPVELMRALLAIERGMGRDRQSGPAKGPRVIDLDLLVYVPDDGGDSTVLQSPELTLPHPALAERRFVLEPLAEIAPEMRHPVTKKTVAEMLAMLTHKV